MKIKVGVLFGGASVEHEVSIITAIQAMNKLDQNKYEIVPIYITKDRKWYTGKMLLDIDLYSDLELLKRYAHEVVLYNKNGRFVLQNKFGLFKKEVTEIDIALPIMHGTGGEDGSLQGYFEMIGIPYCESNLFASCVGQDKIFMKQILESNGVTIAKYKWFFDHEYLSDGERVLAEIEKLGYPVIVKPACLGSSVGIKVCHNVLELQDAITDAIKYDEKFVVEEVISNLKEVNISVLGNCEKQELSVIEEVGSKNELLTYEDKYLGSGKTKGKISSKGMASAKRIIPAKISDALARDVESLAIKTFRSLNSSGVVRIDFLIDTKENKVYVNEINSIPGSLSYYLWEKTNKDYEELLENIIDLGILKYKKLGQKTRSFDTNILEGFKGVKGVKGIKK